ncbi:MAG: PP2C family protein-serine/threonine phosphatase [Spirochaetia bacterium]
MKISSNSKKAYILFIIISVSIFSGCAARMPANNPLDSGWEYAVGTLEDSYRDGARLDYQPLDKLLGLESLIPGNEGVIWVRNVFRVPQELENSELALLLGRITMADRTYLNGQLLGSGGSFPPNYFSEWNSYRYHRIPGPLLRETAPNSLLIKIYINGEGSITGRVLLSDVDTVENIYRSQEFYNSNINILISAVMFIMAAYHLLMFLMRRKDRENLYYALLSFSFSVYLTNFFITKVPGFWNMGLSYTAFQKIIFISIFVIAYAIASFIREFLGREEPVWQKWVLGFASLLPCILYIVIPDYATLRVIVPYSQLFFLIHLGFSIYYVAAAVAKRNKDAYILLLGLSPFILTILFDLIVHQLLEYNELIYLTGLGMPLFLLAILFILAGRFVRYHNEVEELNRDLEQKVEKRTEELQKTNDELEDALTELQHKNDIAKRDMDMATTVQENLYPQKAPVTDEWAVSYFFKPMAGVSGDLYDFYTRENKLKGIALLDVSGHGIASGLITMIAKSIARRQFSRGESRKLNEVLYTINDNICREIENVDNYLTGIFLRFRNDIVEYVNAGHTELIFKSARTGKAKIVNQKEGDFKGWFLGIPDMLSEYTALNFRARKDDIILLYTDCLNESVNPDGEEYGMERIMDSLQRAPNGPAPTILKFIMDEFFEFTGKKEFNDDLTVILIKRQ